MKKRDCLRSSVELDIKRFGTEVILELVRDSLEGSKSIYLSVDMDAIDPAEAPAVGNPSPEGVSVTQLLDLIEGLVDKRLVGFDLNEVSPHFDSGLTAIQASYIVLETLYKFEKTLRASSHSSYTQPSQGLRNGCS